jgi:chemotaxis protein methyltransferase CheR
MIGISDQEFALFQQFIYKATGITLAPSKKSLVCGRLAKRLDLRRLNSYGEYFQVLASDAGEVQLAIDLLTTNETYFFREPKHFDVLREHALARRGAPQQFRAWSAACSSGEETYSIAMVLAAALPPAAFEVLGSDISARVLERARSGHYPLSRATHIPRPLLQRFCLRGTGAQEGTLLVEPKLRAQVRFAQINLDRALPTLGQFDVIFLRNVLIYFNAETKRRVVERLCSALRPGGYFLIGHSETLNEISTAVVSVAPSTYRKPDHS